MIVSLTNNTNRTSAELRFILSKHGGSLGSPGSVRYMFERDAEGEFQPTMTIPIDEEAKERFLSLQDALLENEDVEDIFVATDLE